MTRTRSLPGLRHWVGRPISRSSEVDRCSHFPDDTRDADARTWYISMTNCSAGVVKARLARTLKTTERLSSSPKMRPMLHTSILLSYRSFSHSSSGARYHLRRAWARISTGTWPHALVLLRRELSVMCCYLVTTYSVFCASSSPPRARPKSQMARSQFCMTCMRQSEKYVNTPNSCMFCARIHRHMYQKVGWLEITVHHPRRMDPLHPSADLVPAAYHCKSTNFSAHTCRSRGSLTGSTGCELHSNSGSIRWSVASHLRNIRRNAPFQVRATLNWMPRLSLTFECIENHIQIVKVGSFCWPDHDIPKYNNIVVTSEVIEQLHVSASERERARGGAQLWVSTWDSHADSNIHLYFAEDPFCIN